jgi:aspartate racemase
MKSVGVIGGLGPETTAEFYLAVNFECLKQNKQQRPLILISNVPLDLEIERDLIEKNKGKERYVPYLTAEAKRLEKAGVDFLVVPCNSVHVFIDEIRQAVKIPVVSILEETVKYVKEKGYKNVGLISTSATVKNKIYEKIFDENGVQFETPDDFQRARMDKIILRLVGGEYRNSDREILTGIVADLIKKNVDCVALACTDLQLLLPDSDKVPIFDTMRILALATAREILK